MTGFRDGQTRFGDDNFSHTPRTQPNIGGSAGAGRVAKMGLSNQTVPNAKEKGWTNAWPKVHLPAKLENFLCLLVINSVKTRKVDLSRRKKHCQQH